MDIHQSWNYNWAVTLSHEKGKKVYTGTLFFNVSKQQKDLEVIAKREALRGAIKDRLLNANVLKLSVSVLPDGRVR